ncbi:transmembrane channel-like protein [Adelges cooleyi]|uniref:transmembrane channel-like protein n=1 Tax=Adelges cooleyi TaxID=133065 RepID=UPI00217F4B16|nr:transmembrane channel-like protein [Adelges cooleyi]
MSISRGHSIEKVRFSASRTHSDENDEDYSASVNAILHKRLNSRKGKHPRQRRSSSPVSSMLPDDASLLSDRRRSSAFTTSSGDTAIIIEDAGISQEQIFENIRLHKEVLSSVRQQPWSIRRKMKLVQQAKEYVKKHEGQLQERLAMSKSTRDMLARFHILVVKQWQHSKREMSNFVSQLIPWELTIKEIESQFGTVVASYFTFLRWLFWVNFVISVLLAAFVVMPEVLMTSKTDTGDRKTLLPQEEATSMALMTLLNFEGVLQHSPMFYGYYSNRQSSDTGYRLPTAYFIVGLVVYIYSFVATLRKMAANSRLSKLSEKDDECIFTWKLFTGWDYMIGNEETAHNRISSIILGFKEALLEEAERMKDNQNWKVVVLRIFANLNMIWMLGSSVYAVILVVERSTEPEAESTLWRKNEITVVMTLIGTFFPIAFEGLGVLESYHPRTTLRVQLARIMALNLLNLYTLTFALFVKINDMTNDLLKLKPNITDVMTATSLPKMPKPSMLLSMALLSPTTTTFAPIAGLSNHNAVACHRIIIECPFSIPAMTHNHTQATLKPTKIDLTTATTTTSIATALTNKQMTDGTPVHFAYTTSAQSTDNNSSRWATDWLANLTVESTTEQQIYENVDDLQITVDAYPSTWSKDTGESGGSTMEWASSDHTELSSTSESTTSVEFTSSEATTDYLTSDWDATDEPDWPAVDPYAQSYDDLDNDTEETATPNDRRKRSAETVFNGTHCYREVCQARPLHLNSSEPPTTYQGGDKMSNDTIFSTTIDHEDAPREDLSLQAECLDLPTRHKLRKLCWETMFGQELVKLTVMDLVSTIISTIFVDFARAVFVRYMNRCWCWNLEKSLPQYGDFKIAENILHLVNNQGMVWMGMFFSPGLPIINVFKLMIMMYVRSWAVLTCNVPHDVVFRASRSNNFYLGLLLTMLFLCVLPVGYAIVWIEPSWHCGPFSQYKKIYHIFTNSIKKAVPNPMVHRVLDYIASPAMIIPLLLLLILIIYYLASLTSSLREANNDLKIQLRRERTEERRKMFQLVTNKKLGDNDYNSMDTALAKWRQIIPENKLSGTRGTKDREEKARTEKDIMDMVLDKLVRVERPGVRELGEKDDENGHHRHHYHGHHQPHHGQHQHHRERRQSRDEESRDAAVFRKWKKSKVKSHVRSESDSSDQSELVPEIRVKTASTDELSTAAENAVPSTSGHVANALIVPSTPPLLNSSGKTSPTASTFSGTDLSSCSGGMAVILDKWHKPDAFKAVGDTVTNTLVPETPVGGSGREHLPAKQKARLKLAQVLYKEARRRRQKHLDELENQPQ